MPSAHAEPVRIRVHDTDLACDVRRTVAYRAVCACGFRGPSRDSHTDARQDARAHNNAHRGG